MNIVNTISMKLAEYLASKKLSQSEFGKQLGVTQGLVSHWLTGRANIPLETAIKIESVTRGAVTVYDLSSPV